MWAHRAGPAMYSAFERLGISAHDASRVDSLHDVLNTVLPEDQAPFTGQRWDLLGDSN